jgi:hypothetical protein
MNYKKIHFSLTGLMCNNSTFHFLMTTDHQDFLGTQSEVWKHDPWSHTSSLQSHNLKEVSNMSLGPNQVHRIKVLRTLWLETTGLKGIPQMAEGLFGGSVLNHEHLCVFLGLFLRPYAAQFSVSSQGQISFQSYCCKTSLDIHT